ncbi:MAG TPA: hypothetical protein GX509_11570 [Firmicutes bacterium]|nr:hypothetical protein [Bacillota bacterium]HHY99364.1 hypothetical protein [Bacillota bacterium]
MIIRKEQLKAIEVLSKEDPEELLEYARWLQADKEEYRELEEAETEVARGRVVPWRATR